jgi:phosphate starvation-inducible PhoH-like protein
MKNGKKVVRFDNARELEDVLGRQEAHVPALEETFGVRAVVRDLDLSLEGPEPGLATAYAYIGGLLRARNAGMWLHRSLVDRARELYAAGREKELDRLIGLRVDVGNGCAPVFPRTLGQARLLEAIGRHELTLGLGPAGTGKTWLAMAMAVHALMANEVSRIVLTRPAVEAGEALGYLPGDLQQKILPYLRPLYDALHDMVPPAELAEMAERGTVEVAPLAYMRGRTLTRSFVILDEAQNTTREQMLMFLTRLGHGSKAVVTGDLTQVDLPAHRHPGLLEAARRLEGVPGIAVVRLEGGDVVRHPLVQRIIDAYAAPAPETADGAGAGAEPKGDRP